MQKTPEKTDETPEAAEAPKTGWAQLVKSKVQQVATGARVLTSDLIERTADIVDSGIEGVKELQGKLPEKMQEKVPQTIAVAYLGIITTSAGRITNHGYASQELKGDTNHAVVAERKFVPHLDALLIARELWKWIGPGGKKNKVADVGLFKTYSPFYHLRIDHPDAQGVDFDDVVVAAFIASSGQTFYEKYFLADAVKLSKEYHDFVHKCAEFLPQFVQGDALCKLMCAKPLAVDSSPIQEAILRDQDVIDKFVLFQYALMIEKVLQKMQDTQNPSVRTEKKNIDRIADFMRKRIIAFLTGKYVDFAVDDKTIAEMFGSTSQIRYRIYQFLLASNVPCQKILAVFQKSFDEFFDGPTQVNSQWQSLWDSFKGEGIDLKMEQADFKTMLDECRGEFGAKLLLDPPATDVTRGLQALFRHNTATTASLGPLLLHNATAAQLREVARLYPDSGQYFVMDQERYAQPLIDAVIEDQLVSPVVDDNTKNVFLTIGKKLEVLKLVPSCLAKMITVNQALCKPVAEYLSEKSKFVECVELIGDACVSSAAVKELLENFAREGDFYSHVCDNLDLDKSRALLKILQCGDATRSRGILKKLENPDKHRIIFKMLDDPALERGVLGKLEGILLNFFSKSNRHSKIDVNMSQYMRCENLVKLENFKTLCRGDAAILTAVLKALFSTDIELRQHSWVLPFLRELVVAIADDVLAKSDHLPELFDLDSSIASHLLTRSAVVLSLNKKNLLQNEHWDCMLKSLSGDGRNLLKCSILAVELVVRMPEALLISREFMTLLRDKDIAKTVMNLLGHQQRVSLLQIADADLVQQLFELEINLDAVLATCLQEIKNPVFYQVALQDDSRLEFIMEASDEQSIAQFIDTNSNQKWIERVRDYRVIERDPRLSSAPRPRANSRDLRFAANVGTHCREEGQLAAVESKLLL